MKIMKAVKMKKTAIALCAAIAVLAGCFSMSTAGRTILTSAAKRDLPIYNVQKDYKVCSLSFDIVKGRQDTKELVETLKKYNIKATFFIVGEWVDKYPASVKQLSDAGHEIMNHSDTHPHMPQLSAEKMKMEVNNCNGKIEKVTGVKPILFRPPYGDYDDKVVSALRSMGMYTTLWDCDSLDNQNLAPNKICERVLKTVQPGSIVLFHSTAQDTLTALPLVIEGLLKDGYEFTPVSQLIYQDDFSIDHAGKQIPDM